MTLHEPALLALRRAHASAASYRLLTLAALDQLHEAHETIARQREQIIELREDIARYARTVFHEA